MLRCPVRDCELSLVRKDRRVVCAAGHSFDIARSGYVNLLQPQDRRSKNPGDTVEAVAARRRLLDRGVTQPLLDAIAQVLDAKASDVVLDAGCGEGFYLGSLAAQAGFDGHGIDISIPAIDLAARRYSQCEWIVANADRGLPYADHSFTVLLSVTGRMNPAEFRRVLKPDGQLLVAVAAPDDIIELRGAGRDRVERTINDFASHFDVIGQSRATTTVELDASGVQDVLTAIYRPLRAEPAGAMRITFSLDLIRFKARSDSPRREP
jgi:23S rRNA (guanine745-N1)-methyltransferase